MANADAAFGFRPIGSDGGPYQGKLHKYHCNVSDDLYHGDMLKLSGTSDGEGINRVVAATAGDVPIGVFMGIVPEKDIPEDQLYKKSGDDVYVLVADDPNLIMEVQCGNGTLAAADIGLNGDLIFAEGSTVTGRSKMELDHSTLNTTNSLVFTLIETVQRPDNELGENADVLVSFNLHARKGTQTAT